MIGQLHLAVVFVTGLSVGALLGALVVHSVRGLEYGQWPQARPGARSEPGLPRRSEDRPSGREGGPAK